MNFECGNLDAGLYGLTPSFADTATCIPQSSKLVAGRLALCLHHAGACAGISGCAIASPATEAVTLAEGVGALATSTANWNSAFPSLLVFSPTALALNQQIDAAEELHDTKVALIPPVSGGSTDEDSTDEHPLPPIYMRGLSEPDQHGSILAAIRHPEDGAVAIFDGIVRNA